MFDLCENSAYSRSAKKSTVVKGIKMNDDEILVVEEMLNYYGEQYFSNLVRMGLKKLYDDMIANKKLQKK